jgi:hypothetical protein
MIMLCTLHIKRDKELVYEWVQPRPKSYCPYKTNLTTNLAAHHCSQDARVSCIVSSTDGVAPWKTVVFLCNHSSRATNKSKAPRRGLAIRLHDLSHHSEKVAKCGSVRAYQQKWRRSLNHNSLLKTQLTKR